MGLLEYSEFNIDTSLEYFRKQLYIINNNLDIKSLEQSLDNNTLMHIYLLLAEYYYQEQEYIEGDKYIDLVINNIIRPKEINKLLNNIIRNKYKYKRINNRIRIFTRDCN